MTLKSLRSTCVMANPYQPQPDVCFSNQQCVDELNLLERIKDTAFDRPTTEAAMLQLVQQQILLATNTLRAVFGRTIDAPVIQIGRIGGRYYITLTGLASMHTETFIV